MKMSELHPCDLCGGPLPPAFMVLRFSMAIFDAWAAYQQLGLTQFFGGFNNPGAFALAEVFSPQPEVVKIVNDEIKELWSEVFVCQNCYGKRTSVSELIAFADRRKEKEKADKEKADEERLEDQKFEASEE